MSDVCRGGETPDFLQTAMQYREHLKAGLAKVDAFFQMADALSLPREYAVADLWLSSESVAPRGFAFGINYRACNGSDGPPEFQHEVQRLHAERSLNYCRGL